LVGLIDYGMGNLRSVLNALDHLGAPAALVDHADRLDGHERLILPGVGAFGDGMAALRERGFAEALPKLAAEGRPLLGICLGMQLLASRSFEHGEHEGLGLIPGDVVRLEPPDGLRVPHVGWNTVERRRESALLPEHSDEELTYYFVHSFEYRPRDPDVLTGVADYGKPVAAVIERDNVLGTQFHPEKSQRDGLALLERFLRLC
jgi:glutamine amidotransferase